MKRTILLTGGLGYIGSHTYVELVRSGFDVVILDNLANSKASVADRLAQITNHTTEFIEADILDSEALDQVFENYNFDAVIHFAGLKSVGESNDKPIEYIDVNIHGTTNVLKAMERADVKAFVFSSSATVYGEAKSLPITEESATGFTNPYGFTKLTCEQILTQLNGSDSDWKIGVLRYFNPAGAHPSGLIGEDPSDTPNNLMPYIAKVAAGELEHLNVFGSDYETPDGTGVRDYIHVSDLAKGHVQSLSALFGDVGSHTVNLGTGHGYSVLEMLAAYSKACGRELPHVVAPRRDGDVASVYAATDKAKELLGFVATESLDDMCESSWNWIKTGAKLS